MSEIVLDEIRGAEKERLFSELEDQAFDVQPPGHYFDDFPIWDPSKTGAIGTIFRLGAFDGAKLAAAAGVRLAEVQYPHGLLTVALIGAVATAPEYRGRGIATQLVSLAVEWAAQRGAALAMLWGSEHSLYGRIGFALCGTQAVIPLTSLEGSGSKKISTGWVPGLMGALKSRRTGLVIRDTDRAWLSSQKNVKWFWSGDAQKIEAYAALGRGIDLPHFVHEWGGERAALLSVLRHVAEADPQAILLGSPARFSEYGLQHDAAGEQRLGLARVIDARSILKCARPEVPFTADFSDGMWRLGIGDGEGRTKSLTLSPLETSFLFFGPIPATVKHPWSGYFPLPLWFWGLDAV